MGVGSGGGWFHFFCLHSPDSSLKKIIHLFKGHCRERACVFQKKIHFFSLFLIPLRANCFPIVFFFFFVYSDPRNIGGGKKTKVSFQTPPRHYLTPNF